MKINELLDEASNNRSILTILDEYFYIDGRAEIRDGLVNVFGHAKMVKSEYNMPKIPVKFGSITGDFWCREQSILSLEGAPHFVGREFDCSNSAITSLKFSPKSVDYSYICYGVLMNSFDGISETIEHMILITYKEHLPLLKLLTIKKLKYVEFHAEDNHPVELIINKYLGKGRSGMLQCAAELTKAGYKGNARL